MRHAFAIAALVTAWSVCQTTAVRADTCADQSGNLVCGTGTDAMLVFPDTVSPSKAYAFAWRSKQGLPKGTEDTPDDVEDVLIRLADGAVLSKLGGTYWATGQMRANRYDLTAAWSPDNRAVVEVANSRWDSDSFAYYKINGDVAAKLDLAALVKPAAFAKAGISAKKRSGYAFRMHDDGLTLDARGRVGAIASIYIPKSDADFPDYKVQIDVVEKAGKLSARIVSMTRTKD